MINIFSFISTFFYSVLSVYYFVQVRMSDSVSTINTAPALDISYIVRDIWWKYCPSSLLCKFFIAWQLNRLETQRGNKLYRHHQIYVLPDRKPTFKNKEWFCYAVKGILGAETAKYKEFLSLSSRYMKRDRSDRLGSNIFPVIITALGIFNLHCFSWYFRLQFLCHPYHCHVILCYSIYWRCSTIIKGAHNPYVRFTFISIWRELCSSYRPTMRCN